MSLALLALSLLLPAARAADTVPTSLVVCDDVQDPATLDPQKQFAEKNHTLLQQVYEGLVRFDAKGRIEPALAVSWERKDPLRMRFSLRRGVRFHDGRPFDAAAVRYSIERYLDPATGFPAAGFISSLDRVEVIDPFTVDVLTKFPDGLLLNRLAGFILIVPAPRPGQEADLAVAPVGTGAFRFDSWKKGESVVLLRNPDYWKAGYPKVDRLVFRFLPAEKQLDALRSGAIDLSTEFPGTQTTAAMRAGGLDIVKAPTFYTVTGSFNITSGPLRDRRVRQALNHAVNRDDLVRYDLMGNGRPLATVTMPGEEGHNPSLQPYAYDRAKALKLLKEAGHGGGFTLRALVKVQGERAAKIIAAHLARIGVKLEVHMTTDATVVKDLTGGQWDVFIAGCPDPMAHSFFIQSIYLYGKSPYKVGANPDYDARLEKMVVTLDDGERQALAEDLDRYIHEEALLLFLYQRIKTYGAREGVSFTPAITGMPYFFGTGKAL